jgi:hypothetical protein
VRKIKSVDRIGGGGMVGLDIKQEDKNEKSS